MRDVISQIEDSLEQPFYFLSLFSALAVPDIAGALEAEDGRATGERYASWFDQWVRPQFGRKCMEDLPEDLRGQVPAIENPFSGEDCYRFRCSMLHQGRMAHPRSNFSRVFFVESGTTTNVFHYNVSNDALNIDLKLFCREMVVGAREWLDAVEGSSPYTENLDKFVRRHPNGLSPHFIGVPVIG